jgi:excisionase family DNA binding protein
MKTNAVETLWDAEDVASYLKVSRSMVYKLGQAGDLPCLRVGACLRFDPAVVRAFARGELRGRPGGGVARLGPRLDPLHDAPTH